MLSTDSATAPGSETMVVLVTNTGPRADWVCMACGVQLEVGVGQVMGLDKMLMENGNACGNGAAGWRW